MAALPHILRRHWPSLALGALLTILVGSCLCGPQGPFDLLNLSRHRNELAERNAALADQNAELEKEIAKLQSDPIFLRKMIRQELGYSRPDEFIYRFSSKKSE
jgi:cell division protein FtsB